MSRLSNDEKQDVQEQARADVQAGKNPNVPHPLLGTGVTEKATQKNTVYLNEYAAEEHRQNKR